MFNFCLKKTKIVLYSTIKQRPLDLPSPRSPPISQGKVYSINNTHAFILFDININKEPDDNGVLIETLQRSFDVLSNCLKHDKRKCYHIMTYAKQSIQYYNKFFDKTATSYITKAYQLITVELSKDQYIPKPIYRQFLQLKSEIEGTKIK